MRSAAVLCGVAAIVLAIGDSARAESEMERGAYPMNSIVACGNCHTPQSPSGPVPGMELAGGTVIEEPPFTAYAPNITPDEETGIGRWTDEQILRAITQGISADGRRLAPPMGGRAPIWARFGERDKRDLLAYIRSLPPQE